MDIVIYTAVLSAALMHASWNAIVKTVPHKAAVMGAITAGNLLPAVPIMIVLPLPSVAEIPFIISGALLRLGCQFLLIRAYHASDLSSIYPIARGTVPFNISILSVGLFSESLSVEQYGAMALILVGLFYMAWQGWGSNQGRQNIIVALLISGFITAYSLSDAWGARTAEHPVAFYGWLSALNTLFYMAFVLFTSRRTVLKQACGVWRVGLAGGVMSFGAYALIIWSYTKAPLALVSALRESSIIFATFIAVLFLKERPTRRQITGVVFIAIGAISLRFIKS